MMSYKKFTLNLTLFILLFILLDFAIAKVLLNGLKKYYGISQNSEIALVGHSHLMLGVDKTQIEHELNIKIAKYTREGVNVIDRLQMTKQLLRENTDIKILIYGVDAWTFTSKGLSNNSYKLFYPFLDDPVIDTFIYDKSSFSEYWSKKMIQTSRYDELLISSAARGYLKKWDNFKFGQVDLVALDKSIKNGTYRKINNSQSYVLALRNTVKLLSDKGVKVILFYVPTLAKITDIQRTEYDKTIAIFQQIANEFETVEFLNLQDQWSTKQELFYDPIHLNPKGQKKITEVLIKHLQDKYYRKKQFGQ